MYQSLEAPHGREPQGASADSEAEAQCDRADH